MDFIRFDDYAGLIPNHYHVCCILIRIQERVGSVALFTREEYEARLQVVKQRMNQRGIDTLLVTDPANMNYLTGYDGWSFYVPQAVVVSLNLEQPIWVGRGIDSNGARLTCWIDEDMIRSYGDHYVHSAVLHPMDFVADVLSEFNLHNGYIGVEMDAYYFSAYAYQRLTRALPTASFVDATLLVNWVRLIKSEQEIAYIQQAGQIVTRAMNTALEVIRPGVRESDAAAEIFRAQIQGTDEFSGDYPAIVPLIPSGVRTSAAHLTWTDRRYEVGDAVNIEIAGCRNRYHSPLSRTVVIGQPDPRLADLGKVVAEGLQTALEAVRPGALCEEVEAAWQRTINRYGFEKPSRLGYSEGVNYPPDWGEHTASLRAGDKTVLEPNMVFHMIAGMWYDGYGLEMSEAFRVTPAGAEVFARVDRQLFVIDDAPCQGAMA